MKKKSLIGIGLALAVSSAGLMVATDALAFTSTHILYYADASHTGPIVGRDVWNCLHQHVQTGIVTDYYVEFETECD